MAAAGHGQEGILTKEKKDIPEKVSIIFNSFDHSKMSNVSSSGPSTHLEHNIKKDLSTKPKHRLNRRKTKDKVAKKYIHSKQSKENVSQGSSRCSLKMYDKCLNFTPVIDHKLEETEKILFALENKPLLLTEISVLAQEQVLLTCKDKNVEEILKLCPKKLVELALSKQS